MSQLLIKRTNASIQDKTLLYGELGISENRLYFGSASNVPIPLALISDVPDISELINDKQTRMPDIRYISFSPVQCTTKGNSYKNIIITGTLMVEIAHGTLQVGDQIQMCNKRLYSGANKPRNYKMRAYFSHIVTEQDIKSKILTINFSAKLSHILRYASATDYTQPILRDPGNGNQAILPDGTNNISRYAVTTAFKYYPTYLRIRREQNKQVTYSNNVQLHPNYVRYSGEYTPPYGANPKNPSDTTPKPYGGWLSFS